MPMNESEREAMKKLGEVHSTVWNDWQLDQNATSLMVELTIAVHVIQSFIIQRMLQREQPGEFSGWYGDGGGRPDDKESEKRTRPG